jgi:DNA anti-recombination protein RmuC
LLIEKQAAEIRQNLGTLTGALADFIATWDVLGKHLRNAYSQYDDGQKKLDRFSINLAGIQKKGEDTNTQG